jgi:hypothetical protein
MRLCRESFVVRHNALEDVSHLVLLSSTGAYLKFSLASQLFGDSGGEGMEGEYRSTMGRIPLARFVPISHLVSAVSASTQHGSVASSMRFLTE